MSNLPDSQNRSNSEPPDWQDLAAGYVSHTLDPEESEAVQQWLATHPDLSTEVEEMEEMVTLLRYSPPVPNLPEGSRQALLSRAQQPAAQRVSASAQPTWVKIGGAIAAIALVALSVDNFRLRQTVRNQTDWEALLQQPGVQLYALQGTDAQPTALANVVLDANQQQVTLLTHDLPRLSDGEAYRLWAVTPNAEIPLYCGTFNVAGDREEGAIAQWALPDAACSKAPAQLLVTADEDDNPPTPNGALVLQN